MISKNLSPNAFEVEYKLVPFQVVVERKELKYIKFPFFLLSIKGNKNFEYFK